MAESFDDTKAHKTRGLLNLPLVIVRTIFGLVRA